MGLDYIAEEKKGVGGQNIRYIGALTQSLIQCGGEGLKEEPAATMLAATELQCEDVLL